MTKKIAIVTGASSGMGHDLAKTLQQSGYQVYAGARHVAAMKDLQVLGVVTVNLDVTDHDSNEAFVKQVLAKESRIDLLVNAAGYGSFGALEEVPLDEARHQLEVNVYGIMDLIQQVIPSMRAHHAGRIVNVSSLAGQTYAPMGGWYLISKHALETMSDVLRLELKPFGIDVVVVEPGITATNWAKVTNEHMLAVTPKTSPYRRQAEKYAKVITNTTATVADVTKTMMQAITSAKPKNRYQVNWRDRLAVVIGRRLSYRFQDYVSNHFYN